MNLLPPEVIKDLSIQTAFMNSTFGQEFVSIGMRRLETGKILETDEEIRNLARDDVRQTPSGLRVQCSDGFEFIYYVGYLTFPSVLPLDLFSQKFLEHQNWIDKMYDPVVYPNRFIARKDKQAPWEPGNSRFSVSDMYASVISTLQAEDNPLTHHIFGCSERLTKLWNNLRISPRYVQFRREYLNEYVADLIVDVLENQLSGVLRRCGPIDLQALHQAVDKWMMKEIIRS